MTHTAKGLYEGWSESQLRELEKAQREAKMCAHHQSEGKGAPVCLGEPVFKSALGGDLFCEEHAPKCMTEELLIVRDICEAIKAGLLLMAKGLTPAQPTKKKNPRTPRLKKLFSKASDLVSLCAAE